MPGTDVSAEAQPLVLHVIHHLVIGGLENGLVNLINNMPASHFRHAVACIENYSDFRQRLVRPDVEVIALNRSSIGIWKLRRDIYRLCRRLKPAIVHSRNMSGLDALVPARLAGVGHCVHGEHGWDVGDLAGKKWKPALMRRLHSPFVDRYIAVSKDIERYLTNRIGISPSRVTQIYNGVDTRRFTAEPAESAGSLPLEFAKGGSIVIGTVGRIQAVKDQATLLRAFADMLRHRPDLRDKVRLAIVGNGPLLENLRQLAESLGIRAQTWMPGAAPNVPEILRAFDLFVLPSLSEGISNTILEAMASGLPVLATAVGGNVELVEAGRCGDFFHPGDVQSLATLLTKYVSDPSLRHEQGRAARQIATEKFSLAAMVASYQAVYEAMTMPSVPR